MTLLYEINLSVEADIAAAFADHIRGHVPRILSLDGFLSAHWFEDRGNDDRIHWVIQYELRDQAAMDNYVADHAAEMRRPAAEKFGGRYEVSRRVLLKKESF